MMYRSITVLLLFFELQICSAQSSQLGVIHRMLQGTWHNVEDSTIGIIFSGDTLIEFSVLDTERDYNLFKITDESCDSLLGSLKGHYLERYDPEIKDPLCYSIDRIYEKYLELGYIAGGRILRFSRDFNEAK